MYDYHFPDAGEMVHAQLKIAGYADLILKNQWCDDWQQLEELQEMKMNIELINSQPVPVSELDMIIAGEIIGTVKKDAKLEKWHACFKVPSAPFMMNLAQGFGSTPQDAINDALNATSSEAEKFLKAMSEFKKYVDA